MFWYLGLSAVGLGGVGVWMLVHALRNILRARSSRDYVASSGRVVLSRLRAEKDSEEGVTYWADVHAEYTVGTRTLRTERLRFGRVTGTEAEILGLVAAYPEGAAVTVYRDPSKPELAVLERTTARNNSMLLFGAAIFWGCAGLAWRAAVQARAG